MFSFTYIPIFHNFAYIKLCNKCLYLHIYIYISSYLIYVLISIYMYVYNVINARVNSLSYADDMVLLNFTHCITALQTLLEVCRAYAGPNDIVYNTTKTVCIRWSDQSNHIQGR